MPSFITKKLHPYVPVTALILGLAVLLVPDVASAQLGDTIREALYDFVVFIFGGIAYLGGLILDESISWFIRDFAAAYDSGFGGAVEEMWLFVRDLINLSLILGFIYIAFRLILSSDDGGAKRNLVMLIIAALLVNFSLFFSKAIIDVSHIASISILDALPTEDGSDVQLGLSGSFVNALSITEVFDDNETYAPGAEGSISGLTILLTLITLLVVGFVFAAIGFLIMVRFIVLIFLMLFSPVIVLGMIFPNLQSISSRWLNTFLKQAFLAPAVLICLYASLVIISSLKDRWGEAVSNGADMTVFDQMPFFLLGMGLLIASLVIARQMGAYGASGTMAVGRQVAKKVRYVGLAPARYGARTASGTLAKYGEKANDRLQTTPSGRRWKKAISAASLGSFTERERQAAIAAGKNAKFGGAHSWQDDQDWRKTAQKQTTDKIKARERSQEVDNALKTLSDNYASAGDLNDAMETLGKTIRDMTKEEKEKLGMKKLNDPRIAMHLKDDDFDNFEKSGTYSGQQVKDMKQTRNDTFTNLAQGRNTILPSNPNAGSATFIQAQQKQIVSGKTPDVGKLPTSIFKEPAMYANLTPAMVEERMRNGAGGDLPDMQTALAGHLNLPDLSPASMRTLPANNKWKKWQNSNSSHAAHFFS